MAPEESLTPIAIKNNTFLKLILLEHTPLLTCFGFVTRHKWLVSRIINIRKVLCLIDVGVRSSQGALAGTAGFWVSVYMVHGLEVDGAGFTEVELVCAARKYLEDERHILEEEGGHLPD